MQDHDWFPFYSNALVAWCFSSSSRGFTFGLWCPGKRLLVPQRPSILIPSSCRLGKWIGFARLGKRKRTSDFFYFAYWRHGKSNLSLILRQANAWGHVKISFRAACRHISFWQSFLIELIPMLDDPRASSSIVNTNEKEEKTTIPHTLCIS